MSQLSMKMVDTNHYKQFLGYRKGADDLPEIVPEEAETVRMIYRMYLEGKAPSYIARYLTSCEIPSPAGKASWRAETIKSILTNEKYKGDAILQKTFCTDFLTKKFKTNEGEVPQYYVENSHPAIIAPELFDAVQSEIARRKRSDHRNYTPHCFSGRIFCDECGALYGSKVWNSNTKYRTTVWQCNEKYKGHTRCSTPSLRSETIEEAFVTAMNRVLDQKDVIMDICKQVLNERCDTDSIQAEITKLQTELEVITGLMERLISANANTAMDQDAYDRQFAEYETRYNSVKQKIDAAEARKNELTAKRAKLTEYMIMLRDYGPITGFDETLWYGTVQEVRVMPDSHFRFIFKDGCEITI